MSVSSVFSNALSHINNMLGYSARLQKPRNDFRQLGQDLQTGNLTQAQQDFATLAQSVPGALQNNNNPLVQDLKTLGKDLQSGNLSAAQQEYSKVQQDAQHVYSHVRHHHHHHPGNGLAQAFNTLGQDLQAGNLSGAQQAYSTLQQDLQQLAASLDFGSTSAASPSVSSTLNVTA